VNAKLELGASTDIVTVEASDVQVQTTTLTSAQSSKALRFRELPLNGP